MLSSDALAGIPGLRHGFFTRAGGISGGIYASLNCGFGSGDDPAHVAENRRRVLHAAGMPRDSLVTAHQVHSPEVAVVDSVWPRESAPKVDAMVTGRPGIALGILTADCGPVLLADPDARVIGAAHAGWRGALGGVLEATVAAMEGLGARASRIVATLGPCIAQASYEVGPDFPAPFAARDPADARFFRPSPREGHHLFDLPGYIVHRLAACGLGSAGNLPRDTCAEPDSFFSYRRATLAGERDYGRGLSVICLED